MIVNLICVYAGSNSTILFASLRLLHCQKKNCLSLVFSRNLAIVVRNCYLSAPQELQRSSITIGVGS